MENNFDILEENLNESFNYDSNSLVSNNNLDNFFLLENNFYDNSFYNKDSLYFNLDYGIKNKFYENSSNSILEKNFRNSDYFDYSFDDTFFNNNLKNYKKKDNIFKDFSSIDEKLSDDLNFNKFYSKLVDFRINTSNSDNSNNFGYYPLKNILNSLKYKNNRLEGSSRDLKVNRIVRDSEPWSINEDGFLEDFSIPGDFNYDRKDFSFDSNLLDSINYSLGGGFSLFELISNSFSSDLDIRLNSLATINQLLVESDELRSPWLNGDLQNSKKNNYFDMIIKNNYDSLLLDSILESKSNINWKKNDIFIEKQSGNFQKKKLFNIYDESSSKVSKTKDNFFSNKIDSQSLSFAKVINLIGDRKNNSIEKSFPFIFCGDINKDLELDINLFSLKLKFFLTINFSENSNFIDGLFKKIIKIASINQLEYIFFFKKSDNYFFIENPLSSEFLDSNADYLYFLNLKTLEFYKIKKINNKPGLFLHFDTSCAKYIFSKSKFFYKMGTEVFQSEFSLLNSEFSNKKLFYFYKPSKFSNDRLSSVMLKRDIDILSKTILNKCGGIFNLAFLSKKDNFDNTYDPLTVRTFYVFSKKKK